MVTRIKNEILDIFKSNLDKIRESKKLSIDKFADVYSEKSGINKGTIIGWIDRTNSKQPLLSNAIKLAKALEISLDRLCEPIDIKSLNDVQKVNEVFRSDSNKKTFPLLSAIIAGIPNYKINFADGDNTLFPTGKKRIECEVIYLPLAMASYDRPLYKGDLKIEIDTEGVCQISLAVDTVVGKRAIYRGIAILLNPTTSGKPTYWCLLKLDEHSVRGKQEMDIPAEFITYNFLSPVDSDWNTLIVQVGNIISNTKNPAMFQLVQM